MELVLVELRELAEDSLLVFGRETHSSIHYLHAKESHCFHAELLKHNREIDFCIRATQHNTLQRKNTNLGDDLAPVLVILHLARDIDLHSASSRSELHLGLKM